MEQREILCRVAVALGKDRENWDGETIAAEVDVLRIRAETLAGIAQGFASMIRTYGAPGPADECEALLASVDRWAP